MGMYTEIYVNVDLKKETPECVLNTLKAMCEHDHNSEHLEGKPDRWVYLFADGSYYTPLTSCAMLTFDTTRGSHSLLGKGDIKNYGGEIEAFFDWIKPWVDGISGDFIGYSRYEEEQKPTLYFL